MAETQTGALPGHPTPFRLGLFAALPLLFVLGIVEAQRYWGQPAMWPYLASGGLALIHWIALLARLPWAVTHARQAVDVAIFILIASTVVFHFLGGGDVSATLSRSLLFWAPLISLWWGISIPPPAKTGFFYLTLLYVLPRFAIAQPPDIVFFEHILLGLITLVTSRQLASALEKNKKNTHDPLTGMISAERFEAELAMVSAIADRYRFPYSMLGCAPDKTSAPQHAIGDEQLRSIANRLLQLVRHSDTVCRWEGSVFFVILPNTSMQDAEKAARKILNGMAGIEPVFPLTCSVGVATHQFGEDPMFTLGAAEQALQQSIAAGGNRISLARAAP